MNTEKNEALHEQEAAHIYRLRDEIMRQEIEMQRLRQQIERLTLNGIHSCHAECQRPVCRLTRQRNALLEALKPMIDLAEFWINHRQERRMSEQEYKVWIALGHESNAMLKARAAIKAVEGEKT